MSVNFIGKITKAVGSTLDSSKCAKINFAKSKDIVSLSPEAKKMQEALKEAYEYCLESVSRQKPKERCVAIDELGNILYKSEGEEKTCKVLPEFLVPNTTLIHSHPGEKLVPLSPADIVSFLTTPEIKKVVAVSKDGGVCYMKKPEGFMQSFFNDESSTREKVEDKFERDWLKFFNIKPKMDEEYISFYEKELMSKFGISSVDELYEKIIGCTKPQNPEDRFGVLNYACLRNGIPVNKPVRHAFLQILPKASDISDTDEGIKLQREFNEAIAQRFDLEYQYNG